jgi:hypothetical protein
MDDNHRTVVLPFLSVLNAACSGRNVKSSTTPATNGHASRHRRHTPGTTNRRVLVSTSASTSTSSSAGSVPMGDVPPSAAAGGDPVPLATTALAATSLAGPPSPCACLWDEWRTPVASSDELMAKLMSVPTTLPLHPNQHGLCTTERTTERIIAEMTVDKVDLLDYLPVLNVRQPHATAIAYWGKNVENRSKPIPENVIGKWVLILASKSSKVTDDSIPQTPGCKCTHKTSSKSKPKPKTFGSFANPGPKLTRLTCSQDSCNTS